MARSFSGTDVINYSSQFVNATQDFAFSIWAYVITTNTTSASLLVANGNAGSNGFGIFALDQNNNQNWRYNLSGIRIVNSTTAVTLNVWTHVLLNYNGTTGTLYINGSATTATFTQALNAPAAPSQLANGGSDGSFYLAVGGAWSVSGGLSTTDITALANGTNPATIRPASLTWNSPLDGFASPEPDLSASGNNGTLTGTTRVLGPPAVWRVSQGA